MTSIKAWKGVWEVISESIYEFLMSWILANSHEADEPQLPIPTLTRRLKRSTATRSATISSL